MPPKFRFTTSAINALPLAESDSHRLEYRDIQQPGLVLRVGKRKKTYYLYTRVERVDGSLNETKIRLGAADEITLAEARRRARREIRGEQPAPIQALPHGTLESFRKDHDELLTTAEAAALTKMSIAWFERKRWEEEGGPPYRRRGRTVRYLKSELLVWWIAERVES